MEKIISIWYECIWNNTLHENEKNKFNFDFILIIKLILYIWNTKDILDLYKYSRYFETINKMILRRYLESVLIEEQIYFLLPPKNRRQSNSFTRL